MQVTLYGMKHSHSVLAARLMLRAKNIEYNSREILPGLHPLVVRAAGFPGSTVPALRLGPDLVQGSMRIARALDERFPDAPLFPAESRLRAEVEAAERWGHDALQPVAKRVFRRAGADHNAIRRWMLREVIGWPSPAALGHALQPAMAYYARIVDATSERVQQDLAELPRLLDHADQLIAAGTLGARIPNAADCQVLAPLRLLAAHEDLRPVVASWTCGRLALERIPDFPGAPVGALAPVPAVLPAAWIPPARAT